MTVSEIAVSAIWNRENSTVLVTEKMQFDNTELSEQITLQFLPIGNVAIKELRLFVNEESVAFQTLEDGNSLRKLEFTPDASGKIHLEYKVDLKDYSWTVPLFFPVLNNISSRENLFSAVISIPYDHHIVNSFPTMEAVTRVEGKRIVYDVSLPVIPSMLSVEVSKSDGVSLSTIDMLDGAVLVVLALVGIVGWRKRKMLI